MPSTSPLNVTTTSPLTAASPHAARPAAGAAGAPHLQPPATAAGDLARPDGSPVRVLVVGDEAPPADLLSTALRYEGWQVFGGQANVVELYISYLRRKLDAGRSPMIHTRRGAGYLIKPADPS